MCWSIHCDPSAPRIDAPADLYAKKSVVSRNFNFSFSADDFSSSTKDILFDRLSQLPTRSPSLSADALSVEIAMEDEMVSKSTHFIYVAQ